VSARPEIPMLGFCNLDLNRKRKHLQKQAFAATYRTLENTFEARSQLSLTAG